MNYKLKDIAKMSGGTLLGNPEKEINVVYLDSREAIDTGIFLPIVGEKVDAHKFIPSVFSQGSASFSNNKLEDAQGDYILVEDTIKALQTFSFEHRNKFNVPFIAVTGSVGKTTTKDIISLALENQLNASKTLGNANSQLGLPLTLLRVNEKHDCAIVEMGMSMKGEMKKLAYCARPTMAVFTNVGISHIENLGSKENILNEKLHVCDYFNDNSILFVNGDDELLKTLKGNKPYKVIEFGLSENCDYRAIDIYEQGTTSHFTCLANGKEYKMSIPALGEHSIRNALAGLAVAHSLDLNDEVTISNIASYTASENRQQIVKTNHLTIIDDTYNASPDSSKAAIDVLSKLKGRKVAVLSDMLELGEYSKSGHQEVGKYAKKMNIDFLLCFGKEAFEIYNAFDCKEKSAYFSKYDEAESYLKSLVKNDDVILVKGSRGMKTERFVKMLKGE